MDLYSYFKEGTSAPGAWVVYDTTVGVAAPKGTSFSGNPATFAFVKGTSNLDSISRHLPSGCTMDAAFQMSSALVKAAKALEDGQEIVVTIQSSLTESVSSYDVYFVSGSSSNENCSLIKETTLSNGTLVIRLNNQNYKDLAYIALTRSMEYTDNYTTPDSAANSYVPADHAASSDGIIYGYRMDGNTRVVTVTIPAEYTGDTVNVNMAAIREVFGQLGVGFVENGQVVAGGYENNEAMEGKDYIEPGPALDYRIEIINHSGQKYAYTSGSLWMDATQMENYLGYVDASDTYPTFDGTSQTFTVYRTWNKALMALLDASETLSETLDDATINDALQAIYQNDDGIEVNLPHYYLDYYNFAYNSNAATLDQLPADALFDLFNGQRDTASVSGNGVIYSLETLPELNNLAYNFFYTRAFQLEQSSSTASEYSTSMGAAMAGRYNVLDTKAASAWGSLNASTNTAVSMEFTVTPSGPLGNAYMRYPVACDMGFSLEKVTEPSGGGSYSYYDVTINYYDQDGNVIHSQYVSPDIREGRSWDYSDKQLETIAVGDVTYTFSYADGDPITGTNIRRDQVVNLYYGTESDLEEPDVPGGELPENPDGGDGTDPGVDIEDPDVPGAEVPETGDISALWLALSALSGTGLAGVTLLGRKKRDEE